MLEEQNARGEVVAAICAVVLAKHGLLERAQSGGVPRFEDALQQAGVEFVRDNVVHDGNIITSRGPATAMAFAFIWLGFGGHQQSKQVQTASWA